ncbi:MAG: FAD-binding oxidoreductase, partial [Propionibacteriaceae bacterium]|nr:FAD-binding oxidoreductase [Propionibacteriaceae bacterium]
MRAPTQLGLPRDQILTSPMDIRARAHDASHFLFYPEAVVVPRHADDVARLLRACAAAGLSVTFRSGGTSLSGQAGTSGILADVRRHFDGIEVLDDGRRVRVQPGVTVNRLNAHLSPYGRAFGPDPASSAACTIGGVVANNSSGMACGTVENSYRTLESLVVVLASGTVIDTGAPDADERLRTLEPALYKGLLDLRTRILANPASVATITHQFSMKNTMGYGLNSFLDFTTPKDILTHLLVGSEGTLGFVASATFRTVSVRPHVQTALLVFEDLYAANRALPELVGTGAATLELMDVASIRVGQALPGCAPQIAAIPARNQAALLVEYQATSPDELSELVAGAAPVLAALPLEQPAALTADGPVREQLWSLRKGLYTSVAAARRVGTTALLEDVVVPVAAVADTCADLTRLFEEFSYPDSVIFGHAKDGNIHFMITDEFERQLDRYERFTDAMVDVVLGHHGSLKAEHGTGRVMAPFVRTQYGEELYEVMCEVKQLFDPWRLLNDGVVITDDPKAHLKHIKSPVAVDPLVDACVECGYCEPVCPARTLTLTPRQRIAVQREIGAARAAGDGELVHALEVAYVYDGIHTCAVDGMCGTACPVGINTGLYIKQRRAERA